MRRAPWRPEAEDDAAGPAGRHRAEASPSRARSVVLAVAGPLAIVASVLLVLRGYAFRGMITTQHGDILEQWLPFFDHLGRAIRGGHVPGYQPYALAGSPFANDPQTGWMYLPAMVLFTILPSGAAIRWFLVVQPILAGLGAYWFLRGERVMRPAATAGGLVLALMMADSHMGLELPFAGALAWTMLSLAAAARFVRAERWGPRLAWLGLTALAWGQIAAAHLSHGLVTGTALLLVYVAFRLAAKGRGERPAGPARWLAAASMLLLVAGALAAVNLGYLLPRIAYIPHTTLGMGYDALNALASRLSGQPMPAPRPRGALFAGGSWILGMASAPGSYLGAAAMALSFAGLWSKRLRGLAIMLLSFGAVFYVISLHGVAARLQPIVHGLPFADFYIHAPLRFRYGVIAVLPLLAGVGAHAWVAEAGWRRRVAMLAPGVALWWIANALVGRPVAFPPIFIVGSLAAAVVLAVVAWRPVLAWAIPCLLLVELTANGVLGARLPRHDTGAPWGPDLVPMVKVVDYLREGTIARAIAAGGDGRYLTLAAKGQNKAGRSRLLLHPKAWAALGDGRGSLFHVQAADGYNPTELVRYWEFVRSVQGRRETYNSSWFTAPVPPQAIDLLQVRWLIAPLATGPDAPGAALVTREGPWGLFEVRPTPSRATLFARWRVAASSDAARREVAAPGFDATGEVVLEREPGLTPGSATGGGSAVYRSDGPAAATVLVDAPAAAVVLIRNPFSPGWHATLDGRAVPIMPADFVDQAVAVPAGRHTIRLTYGDPTVGWGALGTGASLLVLFGLAGIGWIRSRRREGERLTIDFGRTGDAPHAGRGGGREAGSAHPGDPGPTDGQAP